MRNIRDQHPTRELRRLQGRIVAYAEEELNLSNVFGIAWWAEAHETRAETKAIGDLSVEVAKAALTDQESFAIRAKVADKRFHQNSQELAAEVGDRVRLVTGLQVDLDDPDLSIYIEVTRPEAFVYTVRQQGPGGLPVGSAGMLVGLFSGGIDSAVSPFLMAKRGARIELAHFYALPSAQAAHSGKIGSISRALSGFLPHMAVHYIPYHGFQLATSGLRGRDRRHELVVFRRFMSSVAGEIARGRGGLGIFSGDSLGQVASQTLENLAAVNAGSELPIFRPLISYDKLEIIRLAKRIGVFSLATEEYKDCCSIIARNPATKAKMNIVRRIESQLDMGALIDEALAETVSFSYAEPGDEGVPFVPFEQERQDQVHT
jgi:thiamine biosynthesis protein ThiI